LITAIVGVGNLGSAVARHLVAGAEAVVLAAQEVAHAVDLARELGPRAEAALVEDAIEVADVVVLALWLDQIRELVPEQARLLENKVVVDPSNPIGFDENGQMTRTLPDGQSSG
jgi:8-hydroxy-5-deazaflavin:NADPH oxidoreductase